ncbi:unnamed protein product [Rhodiola kirilowii]
MSSKDVGNTSEKLLTAESQAPVTLQTINMEVETETEEIESATELMNFSLNQEEICITNFKISKLRCAL